MRPIKAHPQEKFLGNILTVLSDAKEFRARLSEILETRDEANTLIAKAAEAEAKAAHVRTRLDERARELGAREQQLRTAAANLEGQGAQLRDLQQVASDAQAEGYAMKEEAKKEMAAARQLAADSERIRIKAEADIAAAEEREAVAKEREKKLRAALRT